MSNQIFTLPLDANNVMDDDAVLDVRDLRTSFGSGDTAFIAVDRVSFRLSRGKTLCIVGESGSGKSVSARSILQLIDPPGRIESGRIVLNGKRQGGKPVDIAALDRRSRAMRTIRGRDISMIFQEPMTSLSPVHSIGAQIAETILLHEKVDMNEARSRTIDLLRQVELREPERCFDRYTFEYSGGMRQRAMIAMALACNPEILIADEPTTALDVTTQAEILKLISSLQVSRGMSVLFITHDMGVVAEIADDLVVMRRGKMLESGNVDQIFFNAQHDYTRTLIASSRQLEHSAGRPASIRPVNPILEIRDLGKVYAPRSGGLAKKSEPFHALRDISFELFEGESLGIVGESGSGKSTLGSCIARVHEPTSGKILFRTAAGQVMDIADAGRGDLRTVHQQVRMVFQDPFASLNPRMTIEKIIGEPLIINGVSKKDELRTHVGNLLEMVQLPREIMSRYPHAFSGGQRQRISIARALALNPRILIADEATSALDVTVRSQILDLLLDLQSRLSLSIIMITHDLGVVRFFCDRVLVMHKGSIVESGVTSKICTDPDHPYTKKLLSAAPGLNPRDRRIIGVDGGAISVKHSVIT